jgi:EpsI family protein
MLIRAFAAAGLIVVAGVYSGGASGPERTPARAPLSTLPTTLGGWQTRDSPTLDDDMVAKLGVDDYVNRMYVTANDAISVYVGYYASQRQGDTIHSPQNCLPGAGWQPVMLDRSTIAVGERSLSINRLIIQKKVDRQAVFYWYQGRGRTIANEFANKGWLMLDAAWRRRTDGGLVRLITPVTSTPEAAFASLTAFSTALFPHLSAHLP